MAGAENLVDRIPSIQQKIEAALQRALDFEVEAQENERRINELKKNLCNVLRIEDWEGITFSELFAEIGSLRGANEALMEAFEVCQN